MGVPTPSLIYPADSPNTYRATQVQMYNLDPQTPDVSRLDGTPPDGLNVAACRLIVSEDDTPPYTNIQTYCQDLIDSNIFPIVCDEMLVGQTVSGWTDRITELASTVPAGVFELGNERGRTFKYPGNTSSVLWDGYFDACELAANIIHGLGGKCILGSALDQEMNTMLDAAQARTPAVSSFVDGFALHPYGQSTANWDHVHCLDHVESRLEQARNPGRIPAGKPIWITEMGWGVGGNTNSTLVSGQDSITATAAGGTGGPPSVQALPPAGGVLKTSTDLVAAGFPVPGRMWFLNTGGTQTVITYTGISGAGNVNFTGCLGGTGQIDDGQLISQHLLPNATRATEQDALLDDIYNRLWPRRFNTNVGNQPTNNLFLKCVTWFMWHDYVNPSNWAGYCGLMDFNDNLRPAASTFRLKPRQNAY